MKNLKLYMLTGAVFVSILGTLFHFVYEWSGDNFIIGFFTPMNESTWEHIKLIFFPMLIFGAYSSRRLKDDFPCISSSIALGTILGTILIPVLFYTYSGILGTDTAIPNMLVYYISVAVAFFVAYRLTIYCKADKYKHIINILLALFTLAFIIFTVYPPDIAIFLAP